MIVLRPLGFVLFHVKKKSIFLMCCITEHVNTVSQSERSPSSIWVLLVDVRRAFCHFLSCCHWQDECIETDFNVSQLYNAFLSDYYYSSQCVEQKHKQQSVHKCISSL